MTNEQLAIKAKQGDKEALEMLYTGNQRILFKLFQPYINKAKSQLLDVDDLRQYCYFAFLRALHYYDPDKSFKFSTYLTQSVKNTLNEVLGTRYSKDCWQRIDTFSLDIPNAGLKDGSVTLLDALEDDGMSIEKQIEQRELSRVIREAIADLTPKVQKIIYMRYQLNMTFQAVADNLGISRQAVQQQEAKALIKLRMNLKEAI